VFQTRVSSSSVMLIQIEHKHDIARNYNLHLRQPCKRLTVVTKSLRIYLPLLEYTFGRNRISANPIPKPNPGPKAQ